MSKRQPLEYDPKSDIVRHCHAPKVVGLSAVTVWRRRQTGDFPPAIQLGDNSIGYRRRDINKWLKAREQHRNK
jgi:predicted DNA-binding transcriptional regulator AlpA